MDEYSGGSLTPVFKHIHDQECKRSTVRATADGGAELAGDPKLDIFTE